MKVCYVTMQFPTPSETFASTDVRKLMSQGVDVEVFSLKSKHKNHESMIKERGLEALPVFSVGINAYFLGFFLSFLQPLLLISLVLWLFKCDWSKPKHFLRMLFLIPSSFYLFSKIRKTNPDVVHLFWGHYPALIGYLVNKKLPQTQLTTFLGAYDLEMRLGISRDIAKKVTSVFTHAKVNLPLIQDMGVNLDHVRVVYRGVDVECLSSSLPTYRHEKNDKIITAARLIKPKRIDRILDFINELPNISLLIAGDGPEYNNLLNKTCSLGMHNRVEFLGFLRQEDLLSKMAACRFFILLSEKEGERLPNVVKEAMLAGCVCIVSHTPGIDELIDDGVNGFILKERSGFTEFNNKILSLGNDELDLISKNARETILNKFDVKNAMASYSSVWCGNAG